MVTKTEPTELRTLYTGLTAEQFAAATEWAGEELVNYEAWEDNSRIQLVQATPAQIVALDGILGL